MNDLLMVGANPNVLTSYNVRFHFPRIRIFPLFGAVWPTIHTDKPHCVQYTPLHFAASRGNEAILEKLISSGASLNVQDESGYVTLQFARSFYCTALHRICVFEFQILSQVGLL